MNADGGHGTEDRSANVLYDGDCGFCRWSLGTLLGWDRRARLRPVALQDPEADRLLAGMSTERKLSSWHLVTPEGEVRSAGAGAAPLLRLLPGGRPPAALLAAFPRATERAYRRVADARGLIGRALPRSAVRRADRRIAARRRLTDGDAGYPPRGA